MTPSNFVNFATKERNCKQKPKESNSYILLYNPINDKTCRVHLFHKVVFLKTAHHYCMDLAVDQITEDEYERYSYE